VLALQRLVGNAAIARWIDGSSPKGHVAAVQIQRCADGSCGRSCGCKEDEEKSAELDELLHGHQGVGSDGRPLLPDEESRGRLDNRSSARLQRQGAPPATAPDASADAEKAKAEKAKKIHDDALTRLPKEADTQLGVWLSAAGLAVGAAKDPPDPVAASNAWMALGGNMIWAATSLAALSAGTGGVGVVIAASFGGAALGGGVAAEKGADAGAARQSVASALADVRDKAKSNVPKICEDLAKQFSQEPTIEDELSQNKMLWAKLIGEDIAYDSSKAIESKLFKKVTWILKSYVDQYYDWKARIAKCEYDNRSRWGKLVGVSWREKDRGQQACAEKEPFKPNPRMLPKAG
jgi:hypothetical protein